MRTTSLSTTKRLGKLLLGVFTLLISATIIAPSYRDNLAVSANRDEPEAMQVEVRMLRGSQSKRAKRKRSDEVSFAVISRVDFDATTLDAATLTFGGAHLAMVDGRYKTSFKDVNKDGRTDLVIYVSKGEVEVGQEPTKVLLQGRTTDGTEVQGFECFQASGEPCGGTTIAAAKKAKKDALRGLGVISPQAITFSENFDSVTPPALPAGWSTSFTNGSGCALGSNWVTTTTNPDTPPNAAFHNEPNCITDNLLVSPSIAISSTTATLTFRHAFSMEDGFDGGVLEISINGGAFQDIIAAGGSFISGGYTDTISVNFGSPIAGRQAWSGLSGGTAAVPLYITTQVDLPDSAAGGNIVLRWRLATDNSVSGLGWFVDTISIDDTAAACTITCPANITVSNDPNQCGAVVNYPAPTTSGTCGTVVCSPASGSFFPVGTTTVTCSTTAGPSCTFTITVVDTQPPSITCPSNITGVAPGGGSSAVVNYPPPTAADNCPGVTTVCTPPSGTAFPVGTTTVTCTATDASGNTATCTFTVTVFNVCLQDDSNPAIVLLFDTSSGQYRFCCGGTSLTGVGRVSQRGNTFTLEHNTPDRRVLAKVDFSANNGSASLQSPPGRTLCTITDRVLTNNSCSCQ